MPWESRCATSRRARRLPGAGVGTAGLAVLAVRRERSWTGGTTWSAGFSGAGRLPSWRDVDVTRRPAAARRPSSSGATGGPRRTGRCRSSERSAAIAAGLAAYERGDFFLAHEDLEPAWMGTLRPGGAGRPPGTHQAGGGVRPRGPRQPGAEWNETSTARGSDCSSPGRRGSGRRDRRARCCRPDRRHRPAAGRACARDPARPSGVGPPVTD